MSRQAASTALPLPAASTSGCELVVAYSSAHIDGVASELVVHSGHSAQESPLGIEEVRRILAEGLPVPPQKPVDPLR